MTDDHTSSVGRGWTEEERILALDLYLSRGMIGRNHPAVRGLSDELNARRFHPEAGTRSSFRNPNGVAMKLANFGSLDPNLPDVGLQRCSRGDRETWETYAADPNLLAAAVADIRDRDRRYSTGDR